VLNHHEIKIASAKTADFCYTITQEKPIVNVAENQLAVYQPNGTVRMDLHVG